MQIEFAQGSFRFEHYGQIKCVIQNIQNVGGGKFAWTARGVWKAEEMT